MTKRFTLGLIGWAMIILPLLAMLTEGLGIFPALKLLVLLAVMIGWCVAAGVLILYGIGK